MTSNELYHYNIPGSHWGIRRFQNKDGTLTPAGKERYRKISTAFKPGKDGKPSPAEKITRNAKSIIDTTDSMLTSNGKEYTDARKNARGLSDEELRKQINRLQMEKQYADLMTSGEMPKGKARVHEILTTTGEVVSIAGGVAAIATAIYQIKKG